MEKVVLIINGKDHNLRVVLNVYVDLLNNKKEMYRLLDERDREYARVFQGTLEYKDGMDTVVDFKNDILEKYTDSDSVGFKPAPRATEQVGVGKGKPMEKGTKRLVRYLENGMKIVVFNDDENIYVYNGQTSINSNYVTYFYVGDEVETDHYVDTINDKDILRTINEQREIDKEDY